MTVDEKIQKRRGYAFLYFRPRSPFRPFRTGVHFARQCSLTAKNDATSSSLSLVREREDRRDRVVGLRRWVLVLLASPAGIPFGTSVPYKRPVKRTRKERGKETSDATRQAVGDRPRPGTGRACNDAAGPLTADSAPPAPRHQRWQREDRENPAQPDGRCFE